MLASAGVARAETKWTFNPTKRGGGGLVKTLWWQAPTLLNPHFANGTKDQDACRILYEPLGAYDPDGNIVPVLAAEVPSLQNGQVAKDGLSVTWRLKKNVQWHDGKPFTADDVVFNWEYVMDPATSAVTVGQYRDITRFDQIEMKGGGDAPSAARAVLQTGEFDYAWNMQVEDEQLKRWE